MKTERPDHAQLYATTLIILVAIVCAFVLFWYKREGGAVLLTFLSGTPVAVGAVMNAQASKARDNAPDAPATSVDTPDTTAQVAATTINVGTASPAPQTSSEEASSTPQTLRPFPVILPPNTPGAAG